MKKLKYIFLGLLFTPLIAFGATAVPWQINNITDGYIVPTSINGSAKSISVTSIGTSTIANLNTELWVPMDFATNGCAGDPSKTDFGDCVNALITLAHTQGLPQAQIMVPDMTVTQAQWKTEIFPNISGYIYSLDCPASSRLQWGGIGTSTLFNMANPGGHIVSDDYGCTYMGHSTIIVQGQSNTATTTGVGFGGNYGAVGVNFHDNTVNGFGRDTEIGANAYMVTIADNAINGGNGGGMEGDLFLQDKSNNSGEDTNLVRNKFTDPGNAAVGKDVMFGNGSIASGFIQGGSLDDAQIYDGSSNGTLGIDSLHVENSACGTAYYPAYIPILGVSSDQFTQMDISKLEVANDCSGAQTFVTIIRHGGQLKVDGVHIDNYGGGTVTNVVLHDLDNGLESEQVCGVQSAGGALTNIIGGSGGTTYSLAKGATCWTDTSNSFSIGMVANGSNINNFYAGNTVTGTWNNNGQWTLLKSLGIGTTTTPFVPFSVSNSNVNYFNVNSSGGADIGLGTDIASFSNDGNGLDVIGANGNDLIANVENFSSGKASSLILNANSNFANTDYEGTGSSWKTGEFGSTAWQILDNTNSNTVFSADLGTPANTLILKSTGNVGIATSTPGSLLSVGNTNGINFSTATSSFSSTGGINLANGCYAIGGTCIGSGGGGSGTVGSGTTGQFPYYAGSGTTLTATSTVFVATNGNVGLGTTTPWAQLSVNSLAGQPAFVIGSSTATSFIVNQNGNVGIATNTPNVTLSVNGNSYISGTGFFGGAITATSTLNVIGQTILVNASTTKLSINNVAQYAFKTPGFTIATSTTWTGTSTPIQLPLSYTAQTINSVTCYTDAGSLWADIYHTSTHLTLFSASTTAGIENFSSNNTMTAGEKWYATFGTPDSSPTTVSCTFQLTPTGI